MTFAVEHVSASVRMLLLSHLLVSDGTDTTTNYGAEEIAFFSCNDATAYEFPSSELAHVHASDTFTGDDGRLYAIVCGGDDGAQVSSATAGVLLFDARRFRVER